MAKPDASGQVLTYNADMTDASGQQVLTYLTYIGRRHMNILATRSIGNRLVRIDVFPLPVGDSIFINEYPPGTAWHRFSVDFWKLFSESQFFGRVSRVTRQIGEFVGIFDHVIEFL